MRSDIASRAHAVAAAIAVALGAFSLSMVVALAAPNTWTPVNANGVTPNEFLFGGACPPNSASHVNACYVVGDVNAVGAGTTSHDVYRSGAVSTTTGVPAAPWKKVNNQVSPPGSSFTSISCVDAGSDAVPNTHCYAVGSVGLLEECRGSDTVITGTGTGSGLCDNSVLATGSREWDTRALGSTALFGISCTDKNHCVAVGGGGTVLSTADASANDNVTGAGTATWSAVTGVPGTVDLLSVVCTSNGRCLLGGNVTAGGASPGRLYRLSGTTATPLTLPANTGAVDGLACASLDRNPASCFAATDTGVVAGALGGASWTQVSAVQLLLGIGCTNASGGKDCSAGGPTGTIRSSVNGTTWTAETATYTPAAAPEYDGAFCYKFAADTATTFHDACILLSQAVTPNSTVANTGIVMRVGNNVIPPVINPTPTPGATATPGLPKAGSGGPGGFPGGAVLAGATLALFGAPLLLGLRRLKTH